MGFASPDAAYKALTNGRKQEWRFVKDGQAASETPEAAGNWVSFWLAPGSPGAGSAPGAAWADCDNASGSIVFTDVSPQKRYLYGVELCATVTGVLMIYDRLGHINHASNVLTGTGDETVTATLADRYSGADSEDLHNIEAWIEVTEATATTAPVVSLNSYTNSAGTSGRAGGNLTFPATATNVGWMAPFPLQAGDKGVQAINTWTVGTACSTTGECNIVLVRPIAFIPVATANIMTMITIKDGLIPTRIYDDSSLAFAWFATATTVPDFWGRIVTAYDGS